MGCAQPLGHEPAVPGSDSYAPTDPEPVQAKLRQREASDEYDPAKPEYVITQPQRENHEIEVLMQQIARLEGVLAKRRPDISCQVSRHYEQVLKQLQEEVRVKSISRDSAEQRALEVKSTSSDRAEPWVPMVKNVSSDIAQPEASNGSHRWTVLCTPPKTPILVTFREVRPIPTAKVGTLHEIRPGLTLKVDNAREVQQRQTPNMDAFREIQPGSTPKVKLLEVRPGLTPKVDTCREIRPGLILKVDNFQEVWPRQTPKMDTFREIRPGLTPNGTFRQIQPGPLSRMDTHTKVQAEVTRHPPPVTVFQPYVLNRRLSLPGRLGGRSSPGTLGGLETDSSMKFVHHGMPVNTLGSLETDSSMKSVHHGMPVNCTVRQHSMARYMPARP